MLHTTCRRALLDGTVTADVDVHLSRCAECASFAGALARVDSAVFATRRSLPAAPGGLADRVSARLTGVGLHSGPPVDVEPTAVGPRRPPFLGMGAAAALIVLIVAALAVWPGRGDEGSAALLASSAERTTAARTARVSIEGRATLVVHLPEIGLPSLPDLLLPSLPSLPLPSLPGLSESEIRDAWSSAAESLRAHLDGARSTVERVIPSEITSLVSLEAHGEVEFPDRLHLAGSARVVEPVDVSQDFETVVVPDGVFVRVGGGGWARIPASAGPLAAFFFDADGVTSILRAAEGLAEDLGEEDQNGVRVRHYSYSIAEPIRFGLGGPALKVDAWIASDGTVRRITTAYGGSLPADGSGPGGLLVEWSVAFTLDVTEFGAPVSIFAPPPEDVTVEIPLPSRDALLYPFEDLLSSIFGLFGREG